jgi:amino acid transporter
MLPGSSVLGAVNKTTRTPIASIILVAVVGIGINLLSAGIAANVVSICSVAYYFVYLLTVGGALYAHFGNRMPGHRSGDFSLGRAFLPVALSALAFTITVVVIALAPKEGHTAGKYLLGSEVVGLLWYLLYLRPRLIDHRVGIHMSTTAAPQGVPGLVEEAADV